MITRSNNSTKTSKRLISGHIHSCSVDANRSMMFSTVVVLMVVCAAPRAWSCEPCTCHVGYASFWPGLQVAAFDRMKGLHSIPYKNMLLDHTQVLYINGASITTIKENQFVEFKKLQIIHIHHSAVSKVERHTFMNMTNVTEISLWSNLITELPVGLFSDTPGLVKLYLNANKLKVLPKNLYSNLQYLKVVNLSVNQITSIEANCFVNVPLLEMLDLSYNKLTSLTINIIDESSSLKWLLLFDNPWHCDESLCDVMTAAVSRELWVDFIIPTCATPQSLQGKLWSEVKGHALMRQCPPCHLEEPSVARCSTPLSLARVPDTLPINITHLHVIDQQFTTLDNNAFRTYGLLQELHLERNHILRIEPNAFLNLSRLSVLNLADNHLKDIQRNIFNPAQNLTKILLNKNNLTRLNKLLFSNLMMLKEVDLSFNNISFIEEECFVNVTSLRTINLSNNQLQTLQLNVMDSAMNLQRLYLEGNPWRCDEALCGVLDAAVEGVLWGARAVPACSSPPALAAKPWSQLLQHFHPAIYIPDSNQHWVRAGRTTSVLAGRNVTLQCRYCFVSRVTWTLRGVKLPRSYQRTSQEAFTSALTMEDILYKLDEGDYVCQVNQCSECDTASLHVSVNTTLPDTREHQQECGEVISKVITNVNNRTSTKTGEFPWHIALYRLLRGKHEYKCGGSIISPLIVITAAHCLTDNRALKYPAAEFYIGAGKYYSDYSSTEDISAQKRQVMEYHIPTEYRGYESNYAGDLAVVIVKKAFRMTHLVQPVCMDWDGMMESKQLQQNNTGSVVGWGYADPDIPKASAELKRLNLPFINLDQCLNEVSSNFRRYVTLDKLCTGITTGPIICNGDGGGGLVFKWNNTKKYFIHGLVSVAPAKRGVCDVSQHVLYTKISVYRNFIRNIMNTNPVND